MEGAVTKVLLVAVRTPAVIATAHLPRVTANVGPGDNRLAGVHRQQGGQHAKSRGLTCPVGAEEAVDLSGSDGEVDAPHRLDGLLLESECLA
jgi:hypothetical protein